MCLLVSQHITSMDWTITPNQSQTTNLSTITRTTDYPTTQLPTHVKQPNQTPSTNQRPYTRTLSVPKDKAGIVIGMKQSGINKIKTTFNVNLNYISQKDADVVFKITGTIQNVTQAEEEMKRLILSKTNAPPKRNYTATNQSYNNQTTDTDCDCPDCKRQTSQCRNIQRNPPTTPSWADLIRQPPPTPSWPEIQQDWSQSPSCKRAKQSY